MYWSLCFAFLQKHMCNSVNQFEVKVSNIGWCQCLEESLSIFSCFFSSVWGVNIRKIFSVVFSSSSNHNFKICLIYLKNKKSKRLFDCCMYLFLWVPRLTHPSDSTALTTSDAAKGRESVHIFISPCCFPCSQRFSGLHTYRFTCMYHHDFLLLHSSVPMAPGPVYCGQNWEEFCGTEQHRNMAIIYFPACSMLQHLHLVPYSVFCAAVCTGVFLSNFWIVFKYHCNTEKP